MSTLVTFHRRALLDLVKTGWQVFWIAVPRIDQEAVTLLLPHMQRDGAQVRVLTCLDPARVAAGAVDLAALQALRSLPGCEIRDLPALSACVYSTEPRGDSLVTSSPLTADGLDDRYAYGTLLPEATGVLADLYQWWAEARPLTEDAWTGLVMETSRRLEARTVSEEIARVGAFVRVTMRGTRRTRRLDPREFGVPVTDWGRVVRPVEVALYKLDEVIRAKDDLEGILAEHGLEWNGYYLVPRHFLEREWPRLFGARLKQLRERLQSQEGQVLLKQQLQAARRELEGFLGEVYPRADSQGMPAEVWIDMQATRLLTETVSSSILEESGLEYRVLTILPEDERSVDEMQRLLLDQKLRSVQLTFHI
ncbi:MAG TPA: hypothetical protein VD902_06155 [Symbiobacteriaceae bacterium]|nr:hypothetical protein [Symbiobacteriaceae bacterium]